MEFLSPRVAHWLADALLALHVGIVAFVALGTLLILLGGWRGWASCLSEDWGSTPTPDSLLHLLLPYSHQ